MDSDIYFKEISKVDPMKSAMLSAVLPGLGQINNKQAFKVPFVYAGFLGFAHFINENNKLYHTFRNAYLRPQIIVLILKIELRGNSVPVLSNNKPII